MKTFLICVYLLSIVSILSGQTIDGKSEKLQKLWETTGFDVPESVYLDSDSKIIYVSNIGGTDPELKDNNGFISKLKTDGKIDELKWVKGLDAPKGMTMVSGILYVTDIDKVVAIDVKTGQIVNSIPVPGSKFLNDITSTKVGDLIISDSKANSYFKISNGIANLLVENEKFAFPNGILFENGNILSGVGDRIIKINPVTGKWEDFIMETGSVDGLQKVSENAFLISDWSGRLFIVSPGKEKENILDTTPIQGMNAADLCYDPNTNLVYIPTFQANSVCCYKLH
jgi:hypothetical protein